MEEQFSIFNQMKISSTAAYRIQITRQPIKRDNPVLPTCMMVCCGPAPQANAGNSGFRCVTRSSGGPSEEDWVHTL
jgi:hypothetical protein